jgi:hypothetical protein
MMRRTIQNVTVLLAIVAVITLNTLVPILCKLADTTNEQLVRLYIGVLVTISFVDLLAFLLFVDGIRPSPVKAKLMEPVQSPRKGKRNA